MRRQIPNICLRPPCFCGRALTTTSRIVPVWLKWGLPAMETVIIRSYVSITTTLIQVHWYFIIFTYLKLNFKDPGFTTLADRIWVTVLLSVSVPIYRVFLIIGPLRTFIGTARPYQAEPGCIWCGAHGFATKTLQNVRFATKIWENKVSLVKFFFVLRSK